MFSRNFSVTRIRLPNSLRKASLERAVEVRSVWNFPSPLVAAVHKE